MQNVLVGTAGWSVARSNTRFASDGSALERYASVFSAVEVNSSFYRRHKRDTWQIWHDAVPQHFRFSVKLPKTISHERRLAAAQNELDQFFSDIVPLGEKLGAILVQLPPSLQFDSVLAQAFFEQVRTRSALPICLEPRHRSWAPAEAQSLLSRYRIGLVHADPQDAELRAAVLASGSSYLRLHGAPRIYYSAYSDDELRQWAELIAQAQEPCWCILDNTASGAALTDAIKLLDMLG